MTTNTSRGQAGHSEVHTYHEVLPRRLILKVLAVVVILTVALCFLAYGLLRVAETGQTVTATPPTQMPATVAGVRQEMFDLAWPRPTRVQTEGRLLEGYRWIDRDAGLIAIPVEEAMKLFVQRSQAAQPARSKGPPAPPLRATPRRNP